MKICITYNNIINYIKGVMKGVMKEKREIMLLLFFNIY